MHIFEVHFFDYIGTADIPPGGIWSLQNTYSVTSCRRIAPTTVAESLRQEVISRKSEINKREQ